MKILIIYSSLTGNTKKVCEKAFEYLNCEKEIINLEDLEKVNLYDYENIIIGTWIDKATAEAKTRKFLKSLKNKNLYFIGTLAASLDSEHAKKCYNNLTKLCSKDNKFIDGVLARGRVSEELQDKFTKFPLNIIHKFVPNMKEIILDANSHPNESDFNIIKNFIIKNFS
ncbi:MAG: flavodoxin [Fusobacterium sp.]|nr:flavodoxin [Fusobacterium sp.]